jgi:hypothetical protein
MPVRSLIAIVLVALAGCARATLPYTPAEQPPGARISAAYSTLVDRLRIEIDTDGRRLEQAWIRKPDGSNVAALAIEQPPITEGYGSNVGISIGGGSWGGRSGVATGIGVGIPIGGSSGGPAGNTVVSFPLAEAGPGPWPVYLKLAGIPAVTIVVGGTPPAR